MAKRTPYGYNIINGRAVIDEQKAEQLKLYFSGYLEGLSMADAARIARLPLSASTYSNLLKRKEYGGTDFYPAIIDPVYQEKLEQEWERRKEENSHRRRKPAEKGVRIYTEFQLTSSPVSPSTSSTSSTSDRPVDPVDQIAVLYQRIRPVYRSQNRQSSNRQPSKSRSSNRQSYRPSSKSKYTDNSSTPRG